jgi:hypothetical protein
VVRRNLIAVAPWAVLVAASIAFRLPAFVNAEDVNSDAAIVGLQAIHFLRGELSWFLFGSRYQTSVDSFIAALFFLVSGTSALSLMLSAFAGHLSATLLAYGTLRRHASPWAALALVVPLVVTPSAVHTYALHPPRQASLTLVFASIWFLDGAARARAPSARYAVGAALAPLACFADPYALLFAPPLLLLALLATFDGGASTNGTRWRRLGAVAGGLLVGAVPLVLLLASPGSAHGEATITLRVFAHNWRLFTDPCFPWAISSTAFMDGPHGWGPWRAPPLLGAVQIAGATLFVGGFAFAGFAVRVRSIPWEVRRLGIVGLVTGVVTVVGFLGSVMVMDLFSTRYLAALVLVAPFAFAPAAHVLGTRRFALSLAPYAISAAVAGWLAFTPWVSGPRIERTPAGAAIDERGLARALGGRGVTYAMADYWVSYRLTLLYDEKIIVVPTHAREDRYAPYRRAFEAAPVVAYIFDPERSREPADSIEQHLREGGVDFRDTEQITVGKLTAIVARRVVEGGGSTTAP